MSILIFPTEPCSILDLFAKHAFPYSVCQVALLATRATLVRNRTGDNTRPPGLTNVSNKSIAAAVNNKIATEIYNWVGDQLNRFCQGRQGICKPKALDAQARAADLRASVEPNHPILLAPILVSFFDFLAAFPSVSHTYIFSAIRIFDVPRSLINFFKTLYHNKTNSFRVARLQSQSL